MLAVAMTLTEAVRPGRPTSRPARGVLRPLGPPVLGILTVLVGQRLGPKAAERLRQFRSVLAKHGIDSESHVAMTMSWSRAEREQE
jgi:hypothetical protein